MALAKYASMSRGAVDKSSRGDESSHGLVDAPPKNGVIYILNPHSNLRNKTLTPEDQEERHRTDILMHYIGETLVRCRNHGQKPSQIRAREP